jgi:large subunit ribosomal protein L10
MSIIANNSANRAEKVKEVTTIGGDVMDAGIVVVTQQFGLNAEETRQLRVQFHKANVGWKVGKNTLVKLALKGTKLAGLDKMLRGPTALAYSKDPIAAAKVAVEFAKKNDKLKIVGAAMGDQILSEDETKTLASLPSLDQLRGKIIGLLQAPATKIAGILQAPAGQLARVLSAKSKQG